MAIRSKRINTRFTDLGIPKTGLSPSIDIIDLLADSVTESGTMTEITSSAGWYTYIFTTFDTTKDYAYSIDGGAVLKAGERYSSGGNDDFQDIPLLIDDGIPTLDFE